MAAPVDRAQGGVTAPTEPGIVWLVDPWDADRKSIGADRVDAVPAGQGLRRWRVGSSESDLTPATRHVLHVIALRVRSTRVGG